MLEAQLSKSAVEAAGASVHSFKKRCNECSTRVEAGVAKAENVLEWTYNVHVALEAHIVI